MYKDEAPARQQVNSAQASKLSPAETTLVDQVDAQLAHILEITSETEALLAGMLGRVFGAVPADPAQGADTNKPIGAVHVIGQRLDALRRRAMTVRDLARLAQKIG